MHIKLNGNDHQSEFETITELVQNLEIDPAIIIIEQNGTILKKETYDSCEIRNGDVIEIIELVGGG